MHIKNLLFHFLLIGATASAQTAESIYFKNGCNGCHGNYAEGMGTAPRLQGKKKDYIYKRLKAIREGKSRTPAGAVMISFAKTLDENQSRAMAHWLSQLKKEEPLERYEPDDFFDNTGDGSS
jgi:cytochrome c553